MRFNETYDLIVTDRKTQTTRIPADQWLSWYKAAPTYLKEVTAEGPDGRTCTIRITHVFKATLGDVAKLQEHYVREGYETGEEFVKTWTKIYGSFDPLLAVCVIRFVRS